MISDSSGSLDQHADDDPESPDRGRTSDPLDAEAGACLSCGEGDDPGLVEPVQGILDVDVQNRLWLKAVVPLLQLRSQEADSGVTPLAVSGRVQFAFDLMYIAACERIARILRSDLPSNQG